MKYELYEVVPDGAGDYGTRTLRLACNLTKPAALSGAAGVEGRGGLAIVCTQGRTIGREVYGSPGVRAALGSALPIIVTP